VGVGTLAAAGAAIALAGAAAPSASVPAKDSFSGRIVTGTGIYSGDSGGVAIELSVPPSGPKQRPITVTLRGKSCGGAQHCLRLRGGTRGTLTLMRTRVPDVGSGFALKAAGSVTPLGHTSITGTVHGTGFIARGHDTMSVTLTNTRGSVTVTASSATVPGFTSP
jgi:hypothetical protein